MEVTTPMHDVVAPRILEEATTKGITWQGIKTFGGLHDGELIADDFNEQRIAVMTSVNVE